MSNKKLHLPIPVQKALRKLGRDINMARRRRNITMALMAERAGISRVTLAKVEKGDPSVSFGAYASALFVLGMTERLEKLVDIGEDIIGQALEEEYLPTRVRFPKNPKAKGAES